ncbi:MAG: succinate dehydrogenase [Anaerolineae bacterium]|nr:succinate dehydrogenase [Anaerolineae bacterium]
MTAPTSSLLHDRGRFEAYAWRLMRLSGILIIPLVFVHLAIMHLFNSVYTIDYQWVVEKRWALLGWRIYDAFLLWFAGLHGFNGLRNVLKDYVHHKLVYRGIVIAMLTVMMAVLGLGTIALIGAPFSPVF